MIEQIIEDMDYEITDDLPLSAHIEWCQYKTEEVEVVDDDYEANWIFG